MILTAAGEILHSKVEGMIREFARVKSHIGALQDLHTGTVDVYCFQTATESFVAPVLHAFHMRHPNIRFNVTMSSTDEAIEALNNGTAEIGLVLNPPARDSIASTEVFRDTIVAAMSPAHPLAGHEILSLTAFTNFPFVLTETSFGLRQQIDRILDRHAIKLNISCVTNSLSLAKGLAGFDRHCALLPRFVVATELAAGTHIIVPVAEFVAEPLIFCMCARNGRSLSPAAKVFADAIFDFCQRYRH